MHLRFLSNLLLIMIAFGLTACNPGQKTGPATFAVQIHDQPAGFQEMNVHIKRIEIRRENGGETEWETIGEPENTYNLLDLVNGNMVLLGVAEVEPARYTQVQIVLGDQNSVVKDGQSHSLSIPGGNTIKKNINAVLQEGDYSVLNVDFDASRSVHTNSENQYLLVPVIRTYTESETGIVSGRVSLTDETRARIQAIRQPADTVFTSTLTEDMSGNFKLMGLEPGTYDIEIVPQQVNSVTKTEEDVNITAGEVTHLGTIDLEDSDPLEDENWLTQELVPGVELLRQHYDNLFLDRQYISILKIDPSEPGVQVRITSTYFFEDVKDDRLPVSEFGEREGAIAAINPGHPRDGDVYNAGILKAYGEIIPFVREQSEATKWIGASAFGIDENENWHFTERPGDRWPPDWSEVEHASAGSQMLISGGEITEHIKRQEFISSSENNHANNRHPRTAVCMTADSTGILITVDGRADESAGMTLLELAQYLRSLGCEDAINFDGGGSTTMWTKDHGVVNHPSDNGIFDHYGQRRIRAAIVIKYNSN